MYKGRLLAALKELDVRAARECLEEEPKLLDAADPRGRDLLQITASVPTRGKPAAARRQIELLDLLVERGLDPSRRYGGDCEGEGVNLVWHAVCKSRNPLVARHLLERGGEPDGLFAAAWNEDADLIALLGETDIEVDRVVFDETPLLHAVRYKKFAAIEPLVRIGADVNWRDSKGRSALFLAMDRGFPEEVFRALLRLGADPDLTGPGGRSVREVAGRKRDKRWRECLDGGR